MNKSRIIKVMALCLILICVLAMFAGCKPKDGVYSIGQTTHYMIPDDWKVSWKENEYNSPDGNSFMKANKDGETSYEEATKTYHDKIAEAMAEGEEGQYSNYREEVLNLNGYSATLYSYTLVEQGQEYYSAILLIEDGDGITHLAYSGRDQTQEKNEFDQIIETITFD